MLLHTVKITKLNVTLKVFYPEGNIPGNTTDVNNIALVLNDFYENTFKHNGNLLNGLTVAVYDSKLPDIPRDKKVLVNNTVQIQKGIGDWGGLTYPGIPLIELASNTITSLSDLSMCLSHELGHLKAYKMFFDNPNNIMRIIWEKIRGIHTQPNTAAGELVAEDIRLFEGGRLCKGIERNDATFPYIQGNQVQGLKDFYKIFKPASEYFNQFKNNPFFWIWDYKYYFDTKDPDYIEVVFTEFSIIPFLTKVKKFNRFGIFELKNNNTWQSIKLF